MVDFFTQVYATFLRPSPAINGSYSGPHLTRQEITLISDTPTLRVKSQIMWLQITSVVALTKGVVVLTIPIYKLVS